MVETVAILSVQVTDVSASRRFLVRRHYWHSQREVARTLEWKCTLMTWGGPVLALVSLYFFLGIEKLF
jgi:hypothetical protein